MKTADKITLSVFLLITGGFCLWAAAQCSAGSGLRWFFGLAGAGACTSAGLLVRSILRAQQAAATRAALDALPTFEMLVDGQPVAVSAHELRRIAQQGNDIQPVRVSGMDTWQHLSFYRTTLRLAPKVSSTQGGQVWASPPPPAGVGCIQTTIAICSLLFGGMLTLAGIFGTAIPIIGMIGTGVMLLGFFFCLIGALLLR